MQKLHGRTLVLRRGRTLVKLTFMLAGLMLMGIAWWTVHRQSTNSPQQSTGAGGSLVKTTSESFETPEQKQARQDIMRLLDQNEQKNQEAANKAVNKLHEIFDWHRRGAGEFAEDVNHWRYGIYRRWVNDATYWAFHKGTSGTGVRDWVNDKFKIHVLNDQQLKVDLTEVLEQFRTGLQKNQEELLSDLRVPLNKLPTKTEIDQSKLAEFQRRVDAEVRELTKNTGEDSVMAGLGMFVGSTYIAPALVDQVIARVGMLLGTEAVVEGVEGASAVAGGAVAGGGAGSAGGPAGTIIGFGLGVAAGVVTDWWMSDKFKEKLTQKVSAYLDTVEERFKNGEHGNDGLQAQLREAARITSEAERKAILESMSQ